VRLDYRAGQRLDGKLHAESGARRDVRAHVRRRIFTEGRHLLQLWRRVDRLVRAVSVQSSSVVGQPGAIGVFLPELMMVLTKRARYLPTGA